MSLSLKGVLGGLGRAAATVSKVPILGAALKSPIAKVIPGVNILSTALTVGSVAHSLLSKPKPVPAAPMPPPQPIGGGLVSLPQSAPIMAPEVFAPPMTMTAPVMGPPPMMLSPMAPPAAIAPPMITSAGLQVMRPTPPLAASTPPAMAMPAINQAGVAQQMVRAAPAIAAGAAVAGRAVARRLSWAAQGIKRVPGSKLIGTVGGYYILDKVFGWVFQEGEKPKHRRMNVLNPRALARADRRVCGFASVAKKALRQYGYQVSTSRSPRSCKSKKRRCR